MFSPKILINAAGVLALVFTALFVLLLWLPPYTGFDLEAVEDRLIVSRADDWVIEAGLDIGDEIESLSAPDGRSVNITPAHYPASTILARKYHKEKSSQLIAMADVYNVIKSPTINVETGDGKLVTLELSRKRPLGSLDFEVWVCVALTILSFLLPALIWAFRPGERDATFLLLSGIGLSLATISAAVLYMIEMYYLPLFGFWIIFELIGFGNFMFAGFAACLLLYFPKRLEEADMWTRILLGGLLAYTLVTFLDGWDASRPVTEQLLHFEYAEVYFIEVFYYLVILFLCYRQWKATESLPVERAQALWVILAWSLCPVAFFVFYLLPVLLGEEAILSRTWTTASLLAAFIMVIIGVGRVHFFNLERHIGAAYQWTLVSLFFFGLDVVLVSVTNLTPGVTTAVLLGLVLWVYLPIRQWLFSTLTRDRLRRYQALFNQAVVTMVEDSLSPTRSTSVNHEPAWRHLLEVVFSPMSLEQTTERCERTVILQRGQTLQVAENRFARGMQLEYAEKGQRLFGNHDVELADTLSLLFVRLYDFRDGYATGQLQERERIRRDLHDQIGHKLLSLVYSTQDEKTIQLAQDTMDQLRELIKALKEEPVAISTLVAELRQLCDETCAGVGITLHWHDSIETMHTKVTSNQYLNILNIVRELLNNSIRHSRANSASVVLDCVDDEFGITVSDNGTGFDQASIRPGNGLFNIQSRIEEINASIKWKTSGGTQVSFRVPLNMTEESTLA